MTYKGTVGIFELIFKKQSVGFKNTDLDQYMNILKSTNANRRIFEPDQI